MGNEVNKKILELKNYNVSMLDDLNSLSQPINNYGIKFLTFRRVYDDGRLIHFANDKDWLLYSFDHQLWQSTSSLKRISKLNADEQFAHVWLPNAHLTDHVYDAMKRHNLWNGLTLYDKREDYVDLWAFATDQSNTEVMNLYVNELTVIKRFILYLHDKANSLFFPKDVDLSIKVSSEAEVKSAFMSENKNFVLDSFGINKFYFDAERKNYLTKKEFFCLHLISKGLSFKEIARILNISPRTVESHINSIKLKTDANFKNDILHKCKYLINMYN